MRVPDQRPPEALPIDREGITRPNVVAIDPRRYRRVRWFFIKVALHIFWWDILLNQAGTRAFRSPPLPRWQRLAQDYRALAIEMGGILIKLGQFLSIRVDLLPSVVTDELAGLQDAVPAERFTVVAAQIEQDLGRPLASAFAWVSQEPLGSASLAQVYLARMLSGEQVAIKALRPGIATLVATDLAAISMALRWLKYRAEVRRRINIDRLVAEFTTVTYQELDLIAEGRHMERFAADFADNPQVYVPQVHWSHTGPRTLTMEYVAYIKIDDFAAIDAAGMNRSSVAHALYRIYMAQFFITNFVHADPHPGNVFVKPLPHPDELEQGRLDFAPGEPVPHRTDRPFQIVLVDFGMVTLIPERLRASMRDYAIGIGTRDAHRVVQSFLASDLLRPDTDLKQLESAVEAIFAQFSTVLMGQAHEVDRDKAELFARDYRDFLYNSPFQLNTDLLFVYRAMSVLAGITFALDNNFNPEVEYQQLAAQLLQEDTQQTWNDLVAELPRIRRFLLHTPGRLDDLLTQALRGDLTVQMTLDRDARKSIQQLERSVNRLTLIAGAGSLLIAGALWRAGSAIAHILDQRD